jgi:methyltransferase (TIGR00027 family)
MIEGRPSRTALRVAIRRAAHQILDRPLVLDDPIALRIIGPSRAAELRLAPPDVSRFDRFARTLRATLVARSRVAEDELSKSVAAGVRQYVVLGAGLDTFAYRNPFSDVRVFEVDHPASQAWKIKTLRENGIAIPDNVTFVPVDFERQRLPDALVTAGLVPGASAWFGWLGVTFYLERAAVMATLRDIHALAGPGGGVAFDYGIDPKGIGLLKRLSLYLVARRVRRAGEPFKSFFEPQALQADLRTLGFGAVVDLGPRALNDRYFSGRADHLHVGSLVHVVVARV